LDEANATIADLEKGRAVRELEIQETERRLKSENSAKDAEIGKNKERENKLMKRIDELTTEKDDLNSNIQKLQLGKLVNLFRFFSLPF